MSKSISAAIQYEVGAEVLGLLGIVASWRRMSAEWIEKQPAGCKVPPPLLTISACAETDENGYTPASSVTITTREGLIALRKAVDEALNEGGAA